MAILEARGLTKSFARRGGREVVVLKQIDLALEQGRTLGLVGESGCGKTTLARCLTRLTPISSGKLLFEGTEITRASRRALRPFRRAVQPVFQDPQASLNPQIHVSQIIEEALVIHRHPPADRPRRIGALLERVGLDPELGDRFPHQLSAGQRQRVAIARALAVEPRVIVADEPLSALDTPVQAQILNLLLDLQQRGAMTYLLISHDLRAVHHLCHEIAVLYLGRLVERAPAPALIGRAQHPYSRALVASGLLREAGPLAGEPPAASRPPPGCPFHPRCPLYRTRAHRACVETFPSPIEVGQDHWVSCHEVTSPDASEDAIRRSPE
jgi:oligopeptide/dipeptide ABC transporter ATP-binding protein